MTLCAFEGDVDVGGGFGGVGRALGMNIVVPLLEGLDDAEPTLPLPPLITEEAPGVPIAVVDEAMGVR